MSFGLILLGLILLALGFVMVWKTNLFLQWFGDLGQMLGFFGASWLSWKTTGLFLMLVGFLLATNLLPLFFQVLFGRLFLLGG